MSLKNVQVPDGSAYSLAGFSVPRSLSVLESEREQKRIQATEKKLQAVQEDLLKAKQASRRLAKSESLSHLRPASDLGSQSADANSHHKGADVFALRHLLLTA